MGSRRSIASAFGYAEVRQSQKHRAILAQRPVAICRGVARLTAAKSTPMIEVTVTRVDAIVGTRTLLGVEQGGAGAGEHSTVPPP
jgi:hypothetical protein